MEKKAEEVEADLKIVLDAAGIHLERLTETLNNSRYPKSDSFNSARLAFIRKTQAAIQRVQALKLTETLQIKERVRDLTLEESVDLMLALEDRIRNLRSANRSEFS